jgi:membrane protein required for colicin V production
VHAKIITMGLSILDYVLIFVFLITAIHAAFRGFVVQITGVAWLVIGLLFAVSFYPEGGAYLRTKILSDVEYIPEVLAFLALFWIAFIVIKIFGTMLREIVERLHLSALDRILGVMFGIIKGIAVVGFILFIIRVQPLTDTDALLRESSVNRLLMPHIEKIEKETKIDRIVPLAGGVNV